MEINEVVKLFNELDAVSLMLVPGAKPMYETKSARYFAENCKIVQPLDTQSLWDNIKNSVAGNSNALANQFMKDTMLTLTIGISNFGRLYITVIRQRGSIAFILKRISGDIPNISSLNFPEKLINNINNMHGLLIIYGDAKTNKNLTKSIIAQYLLDNYNITMLTLEYPIEYLLKHNKGVIMQKEIDYNDAIQIIPKIRRENIDVVIIDNAQEYDTNSIIGLCESGKYVIITLTAYDIESSISDLLSINYVKHRNRNLDENTSLETIKRKFAKYLSGIIYQYNYKDRIGYKYCIDKRIIDDAILVGNYYIDLESI